MPLVNVDPGDNQGLRPVEGISLGECHAGLESFLCVDASNRVICVRQPIGDAKANAAAAAQKVAADKAQAAQAAANDAAQAQAAADAAAADAAEDAPAPMVSPQ